MTLEFWYDFSSPYAYLGSTQVEAVAARTGMTLSWKPMLLGGLFRIIGTANVPLLEMPESKRRYNTLDMYRWADHWGVPLSWPSRFPMRTVKALRMALAAGDGMPSLSHAIFAAYWVDDLDIDDDDVLVNLAGKIGLDGSALLASTQDPEVKRRLIDLTNEAADRGVCGAPSFFVGEELYWGQDRLPLIEARVRSSTGTNHQTAARS